MADNNFRTFHRDAGARDAEAQEQNLASHPLAELARLIGQSDSYGGNGGRGRDFGQPAQAFDDNAPMPELDWGATHHDYAADSAERNHAPPRSADPGQSYSTDEPLGWPRDRDEAGEPASARGVPGYGYGRDDLGHENDLQDARYGDDARSSRAQPVPYVAPSEAGGLALGQRGSRPEDQAQDDYQEQAARPRRSGTIVIIAMVGLAVLGTAGALGYRAMFGGSLIPSLPPIIKPGNTPVKIVPNHDAQVGAPKADSKGTGDQLVTHEEKPVDVQSANPPPRVVTTIPVISNGAGMPAPNSSPPTPGPPPASSAPTTAAPVVPSTPPAGSAQLNSPAQPMGAMGQMTSPMPPPSGSKPVHTVTIRPDQPANAAPPHAAPAQAAHPAVARQAATKPIREAAPRTASAGPLSIVPNQEGAAPRPEPRERTATVRSSEPMPLTGRPAQPSRPVAEAAPARSGGYAVQVSSQRSEADAMASFRSLQAKYPQQLRDRRATIRRADLGAKGVYFRALVGPFASAEQAASLCSSLKAAGGTCLIQRN